MEFGLVSCWLSRSGLTLSVCAPTFINPEFTDPIFCCATEATRNKSNTNQDRKRRIGSPEKAPALHGPFMIHHGLKIRLLWYTLNRKIQLIEAQIISSHAQGWLWLSRLSSVSFQL